MVSFNSSNDINLLSEISNSGIINTLKGSSMYDIILLISLTIFLIYFLLWIFSNTSNKAYKRITKYTPEYKILLYLSYLSLSFVLIIGFFAKIFNSKSEYSDLKKYLMDFIEITALFQIVDFLSIIFILILLFYRHKDTRKYFNFKNLSSKMKQLVISKISSYIIYSFVMAIYFINKGNIDSKSITFYLILTAFNEFISRILISYDLIHSFEIFLKEYLTFELPLHFTTTNSQTGGNNIELSSYEIKYLPPSYEAFVFQKQINGHRFLTQINGYPLRTQIDGSHLRHEITRRPPKTQSNDSPQQNQTNEPSHSTQDDNRSSLANQTRDPPPSYDECMRDQNQE